MYNEDHLHDTHTALQGCHLDKEDTSYERACNSNTQRQADYGNYEESSNNCVIVSTSSVIYSCVINGWRIN